MSEKRPIRCWILGVTFLSICASSAGESSARKEHVRLEEHPDYFWIEKRFDDVYGEAIARAEPHQRAIFKREHARWFLERMKLKSDPDTYIAYTEQEIRYFAGTYDEP
jgi:hypothetical protein